MKKAFACLVLCASIASAALTRDQKLLDFQNLAALYAKNYAPYEWKRDVFKFDLFDLRPWMDRVANSKNDLEFYEICIDYVASLNDAHDVFTLASDWVARLYFGVDVYDNKVYVDGINRTRLPSDKYDFAIGDEVVSVDGMPALQMVTSLAKYNIAANNRSTQRLAANLLTVRPQTLIPRAIELPDTAVVVFRNADGEEKTITIPWVKTGTPLTSAGSVPLPKGSSAAKMARAVGPKTMEGAFDQPAYMAPLLQLQNAHVGANRFDTVVGFGARNPIYRLPSNFTLRLGRVNTDVFYSGTYMSDGLRIGYIRIPNYSQPVNGLAALQWATEMAYFQANTDGLIIDDTRNPGGSVCYLEQLVSFVMPTEFRTLGFEIRATSNWVAAFSSSLETAKALNAEQWVIDLYGFLLDQVKQANSENRGKTGPLPLCTPNLQVQPARDRNGNFVGYSKPIMVLADDMSASGGDAFPAIIQDNQRGIIFGYRTMGAGGSVIDWGGATIYSEGDTRITISQMNRKNPVVVSDYPTSKYVENVGVRPDIEYDYQTRDNLMNNGVPFVNAFTKAMVDYIRSKQ